MRIFILFLALVAVFGGIFLWPDMFDFYSKLTLKLPQIEKNINALIQEAEKRVVAPPPLRAEKEAPESFLTRAGIIQWTNIQREKYGLLPFKESAKLSASAVIKAEDMLAGQYFDHISLLGEGVADLAKVVGYEFIAIGENLALGNFQDDEVLVQGWMDSPGHRENILSSRYQEIGVAVLKGEFEGKNIWLAVQHFGLPLAACHQPSKELREKIEENKDKLKEFQEILFALQQEIEAMKPKRGANYTQKIEEYNNLVAQYNVFVAETEDLISQYNEQAFLFNECAAGLSR